MLCNCATFKTLNNNPRSNANQKAVQTLRIQAIIWGRVKCFNIKTLDGEIVDWSHRLDSDSLYNACERCRYLVSCQLFKRSASPVRKVTYHITKHLFWQVIKIEFKLKPTSQLLVWQLSVEQERTLQIIVVAGSRWGFKQQKSGALTLILCYYDESNPWSLCKPSKQS